MAHATHLYAIAIGSNRPHGRFGRPAGVVEAAIARDNAEDTSPISLYFHLPFCESRCWFCGCNTVITRRRDSAGEYLVDLAREVRLTAAKMNRRRLVTQIHLGGGTPAHAEPWKLRNAGRTTIFPERSSGHGASQR